MDIDLSQPAPRVRTLEEAQSLIDALWALAQTQARQIEALNQRIAKLEERLATNSRNSSTPPSADPHRPKAKRSPTGKKRGAQPGHAGKARTLLPPDQVTQAHDCQPAPCPGCGAAVKITGLIARHQVIDLPPMAPVVTEYRLFAGACRGCGRMVDAALPPGVSHRMTGPRLLAVIGTLGGVYHLSKRQTQGVLADLFGIDLSVGAISEGESEIGHALDGIVAEAHAHVQAAAVVHADETGHKQCGARHWMWLVATQCVAVFLIAATRSAQAARTALGTTFAGILVSDRYNAYAWVDAQHRQLCWAHLMRDFTKIAERSGASGRIGDELIAATQRMFACWHRVRDGTLRREAFGIQMPFLQHRIQTLLREGAACRHAETARTCRNILNLRCALWTFLTTPGVEPTNNHAERTLRRFVIWRKISFGTQSPRGSRYVERIMTVAGSCRLQGRNVLCILTRAIQAHWGHGTAPSLVPA
ncbi:IS66 family transposase [Noviherbaspirillum galbum]|uniref:IS66 family transposase n=1 Tax=Noviherbaspirillum galbum TaxID=2709383 RepID=A0A6B3SH54_9BURK|nr:IS66 family transposase [Noviherbaspirillum galbum]NEX60191.1 IS66 family transposase [Noviherbaspirillum galbum]